MRNIGRLYQGWVIFLAIFFVALAILMGVMTVVAHAETTTFGHQYYEERGGRLVPRKDKVRELEMTGYTTDMDAFCEENPHRAYCVERNSKASVESGS